MHNTRKIFFSFLIINVVITIFSFLFSLKLLILVLISSPFILIGLHDIIQKSRTVLRNFPVIGHLRFLFESIRPEIYQYFVESDTSGRPFSRDIRAVVYQRAKRQLATRPFGTLLNVYQTGYEWVNHSIKPLPHKEKDLRVTIGGDLCLKKYSASIFNISAMSYGSLSAQAVLALNGGAKLGGFAHNTGEGAISDHHLKKNGDLIWQIGTAYFGCRDKEGKFSEEEFAKKSSIDQVKMIELKLSQGAKPGHGGILPAIKNTSEIAKIRGVKVGTKVLSPGYHTVFSNPIELCSFIRKLRELSGGKPIGFKLCIGKRREFIALCKAMIETDITPDFITIDGAEGGTGAAPLEFANRFGCPLGEALVFAYNTLVGFNLKKKVKLISSGRIITAFDIVKRIAMGSDLCSSARGMMFSLGCIQALQCNRNICPTGITTHRSDLAQGLVVGDKEQRVFNYHKHTIDGVNEILSSMGLDSQDELKPWHIMKRVASNKIQHYGELMDYLEEGALLKEKIPESWERSFYAASAKTFSFSSNS